MASTDLEAFTALRVGGESGGPGECLEARPSAGDARLFSFILKYTERLPGGSMGLGSRLCSIPSFLHGLGPQASGCSSVRWE